MIRPNWEIFSAKFSTNKETTFEWFAYLLFCREFNLPKGWFGFKNQSGIEKNPIKYENEVIGFQAKFYSTSLSDHKDDFLEMLKKTKRDYPLLTKILIYTNQLWGQAYSNKEEKMTSPKALLDIENKAQELNISIEWREASFFESEFVTLEHDDLSKYFFTEELIQGWQRFDDWSNTKANIEEPYFVDNDIKVITPQNRNNSELNVVDGINAIRDKLCNGGASVRFVGLSGVGKTRFAQALFDDRIGENNLDVKDVWYCDVGDSPNPPPEHFIEELKLKNKPFILIVDNCGQDTHANLTKKVQSTEISLLTIEYDVKDDLPERTDVYKLQPNSTDIIQKVIERHYPDVNNINRRKIADFSGGNYRLALAISSNIEKTDNLALLTDSELFERLFWQKGRQNEELFKIAKNFALVYSFNIEDSGEENSELDFLSNFARVDSDTAIEAIEMLKSKDIVQQRGVWRAILPHALANHLAKELISTRLVNQLDKLTKSMPERLQRSFIKRLSYFHDLPKIKDLVTLWFSNEGFLGEKILTGNYDAQDLVKIRLLSQIDEDQLLNLFEKKHHLDPNFLTRENLSFVEISHLIRALAYQEHNFEKAFHLLVYFAKDEKENERNNSIMDLLTSLFRLRISETLANLEQKKEVLTTLHANEENLPILLACLSKALNFHESGYLIRGSNEGGKSSDYGYQPKTYDELWSWTEFLLEILNKLDQQSILQARKIFVNNLKQIIWTCGKVDFVKAYLEKFSERCYFSEAHTQILNIINFNEDKLKSNAPNLLSDLVNLEQSLRPTKDNVTELIKSYILVSDHDLYKMTKKNNDKYAIQIPDFDNYEDLVSHISNELMNVDKLIENIDLLIKANTGWMQNNYLIKLGEASSKTFVDINQCINSLRDINLDKSMRSSEFLLGLLVGFKNNSLDDFYVFIEFMRQNDSFKNTICLLLIQACQNDDDFQYFSQLIIDKKIDVLNFPRLSALKYHNKITNDQFEILIDSLIYVEAIDQVRYVLLDECSFQKKITSKYESILLRELRTILKNGNLYDHSEEALEYLFTLDDSHRIKVLEAVKSLFDDDKYISIHRDSKNFKLLKICVEKSTELFLPLFLQDQEFLDKFWSNDLRKVLVHANQNSVLSWIGHDERTLQYDPSSWDNGNPILYTLDTWIPQMGEGIISSLVEVPLEAIDVTSRLVALNTFMYKNMLQEMGLLDDIENLTGTDISVTLPDLDVLSSLGDAAISGNYYDVAKTIAANIAILSPYKVGIPLALEGMGQAALSGDARAIYDNALGMLLLARDYKKSNGELVKGLNTLTNEYQAVLNKQLELKTSNNTNLAEIRAWAKKEADTRLALANKVEYANALAKKQFIELDRNKGNETLHSPLKQAMEETPTNIKSVSAEASFLSTKESQVFKHDWNFTDEAMSLKELTEIAIGNDVLLNWEVLDMRDLTPDEIVNLPPSIRADDVKILKIEDYTGIPMSAENGITKTIQIVMMDDAYMTKNFGEGTDASFQLAKIPNSKDAVSYSNIWKDDHSPLTIYMNKELLKTVEGFNATLARMEDSITQMVDTLKKADDANKIITYGKLQKDVDSFMADYAYTTDLTARPNFCFVGGTLIHTDKGLIPIKDIKVGDRVLSKDESGEGELVYKPVTRTIKTENVPVCFATFTPESVGKVPFSQRANLDLYADILCTSNHPFWIEGKGWIAAEQMEMNDNVLLQDGSKAWNRGGGYEGKGVELVFKTDKTDVGFVPDFGGSTNQGRFVDLNTGRTIRFGSYTPVYKKLHAVRDLWHNPTAVQWEKGEGPVTTTVYNFEVADTHTYFVGEHGVWVHNTNCGSPKVQQGMVPILPEGGNGTVYWSKGLQKAIRESDWDVLAGNISGMVGFLEKTPEKTRHQNNYLFEIRSEGWISDGQGNTVTSALIYKNPKTGGMNYIKLGDARVMVDLKDSLGNPVIDDFGNVVRVYSNTTLDGKSKTKWTQIDQNRTQQAELLENLYRLSSALDQNRGRNHVIEFENIHTLNNVKDFLEDFKQNPSAYDFSGVSKNLNKADWTTNLNWLNENIYFAAAKKVTSTDIQSRPAPDVWYSLRQNADGSFEFKEFTQAELQQQGTLIAAKDMPETLKDRDFVNLPEFAIAKQNDGIKQTIDSDSFEQKHSCFAAGTMVHTNQGLIPIEQLKAGDLVLSKLANGEFVYKPILRTIVTENVQVSLIELEQWVDPSLPMRECLNLRRLVNQQKPIQLLVTANHPFWIENKGWRTAEEMTWEDLAVSKDGTRFVARSGNNPYKDNVLALVYKTDQPDIGFVPYFDEDNPPSNGSLIRLSTAEEIGNAEYKPVLSKLFVYDKQWKENLLGQLPENQRANAEFYGFKQGHWVDPETVEWNEGEGFLTTTVYNLEVADTHTYFVGEAGIWVHNCGGEETTVNSLTLEMVEALLPAAKQYWIDAGISEYEINQKLSHYSFDIRQLADSAAALTNETQIAFSPNAAGMGWFVDSTPEESSEFNMTGANYGTAIDAELTKRVDVLTVLVHEIGHVLGLTHASHDHDIMSPVLETGVRRLPTQEDISLFLQTANSSESENFAGIQLLIKRNTQSNTNSIWHSDIEVSQQFTELHQTNQIWKKQGGVTIGDNSAILQEVDKLQTNLSQAFKVGEYDRVLTFTVKDQQLSDYNNRPDDAFEVALLDAQTGEALFKVNDLNNTDSLFNLQANGTYSLAQGIERIINADGTQTFFINLDQALVGRDVLLSFDLLGFSEADSHVTLSNIRMVAESMAINDQYKLDEDTILSGNVLNNDVLIHQTVDNVILVNAPQHGELILKANGEFSYTPHANYFGEDQFSYYFVMTDGIESKVATVKLDIQSVNDAPEFVQQPEWEIIAGQPLVLDFDQYVQDIENDDIQVSITVQPEFGSISFDAQTGQYIYLVDKDFVGNDSFSIVLSDGEATLETYTFSIKVLASNTAPELVGQNIVTDEDRSIVIDLLATAYDEDADTLTAVMVTQPEHGRLELLADGRYQYVPADNYHGTDSFSYSVSDGELSSQVVSVNIVIHAVNDAPELSTQQLVTDEDTSVIFNPFATASDIDSVNLTAVIVVQPQNGRLTQISTGAYLYVPYENYNGTDSFSYLVSDGELNSQIVTVSIVIHAVNDAPVASPMIKTLEEDTEIVFSLLGNAKDVDGDNLTAVVVNPPLHGQLTEALPGIYHYVPEPNFNGELIFSYYVTDGVLQSETVNVLLVVTPVNDKPTLTPRIISMVEDGQLMLNLLENAHDIEGDQLSIVITEPPFHGQFTAAGGDYYHFIPELNFNGEVTFSYYVTDGQLNSETVNILIIVNAVNDAPVLSTQNLVTDEDTAIIFNPLLTASDVDGDSLSTVIANAPTHGQLVQLADGRYQYQPVVNYYGTDSFSYFVTDGQAQSQIVNVNITINPVNDMPIAKPNAVKGQEDQALILKWSDFSLSDIDGDTLKLLISSLPERGLLQQFKDNQWIGVSSLTLLGQADFDAGHVRFAPAANEASDALIVGIGNNKQIYAQIGYKAFDGQFYSEFAYLNIQVEAVADQPIVSVGSSTTQEIIFQTGWETAVNQDSTSTLLKQNVFEGWTLLKGLDCNLFGTDGFEIWSNNDRMDNAFAIAKTVQAKAGNGQNWLELNDAGLFQAQTLGISRNVETELGRSYNLSFDYAGRLGFSECFTQIAIYVDGKRIATYTNTSPNDQLNWKNVQFSFVGTGKAQNIQIRIDAPLTHLSGRGAMIDNIVLSTQKFLNTGKEDQSMLLPELRATLQDTDGSEQLKLALVGLPVGSQLTDGTHQFIVTEQKTVADITGWNMQTLQLTPPKDFSGEIKVQVVASSIERANGDVATAIHELKLQIDAVADVPVLETQQSKNALTSLQLFQTEWSGVYNTILNKNATVVYGSSLDGWTGRSDQLLKLDAFELWHAGDQIKNASGKVVSLQGKTSNAWIRLNDGKDTLYQQNAIERRISTINGNVYNLSLDMAGLSGLIADYGRIGIYLDGQRIASFDAASDLTALNWQQYNIDFNGNGKEHVLRIQLEGNLAGRSAFISNIRLVETYISTANTVYAAIGQTTYLPVLAARSTDLDGSETIKLEISGLSQGTVLTDGTRYITVQSVQQWIDISQWDTTQLRFASNSSQNMTVQVRATAIEQSNQHSVSKLTTIQLNMLDGKTCTTPWQLLNGFVSAWNNHVSSVSLAVKAQWACPIQFNSTLDFNILKSSQDEEDDWFILREHKQSESWLKALELQAQQNWKKLI